MGAIYLGKKLGRRRLREGGRAQAAPARVHRASPSSSTCSCARRGSRPSLDHANIVHTFDLVNAGDDYFIVMEYVRGGDLRTMLKRVRRSTSASRAAGRRLHRPRDPRGARLRAPKPRRRRPPARPHPPRRLAVEHPVLGAGRGEADRLRHRQGVDAPSVFYKVKGKVGYMSPEQARGEPVDARSRSVLARRRALRGAGRRAAVRRRSHVAGVAIYAQPIAPPSQKRPEIPADLDAVILKALSLDPAGRFQSAEEFQEALTRVATRHRAAHRRAARCRRTCKSSPATMRRSGSSSSRSATIARADAGARHRGAVDDTSTARRAQGRVRRQRRGRGGRRRPGQRRRDLLRARNRPPSLPTGELTSVIAVRRKQGGGSQMPTKAQGRAAGCRAAAAPLASRRCRRLQPSRAAPIPCRPAPRRVRVAPQTELRDAESRAQHGWRAATARRATSSCPPVGEETQVHPPSQAGFARSHDPLGGGAGRRARRLAAARVAPGDRRRRGAAAADVGHPRRSRAARRSTAPRIRRPRRIIGIMIVLLLIGIGVALGVAFSGPELEVTDPTAGHAAAVAPPAVAPTPRATAGLADGERRVPFGRSASGAGPSELPGPPPATSGTP